MVEPIEIPQASWFRLAHYARCKDWTDKKWFAAISNRLAIDNRLRVGWTDVDAIEEYFAQIAKDCATPGGIHWAPPGRTNSLTLQFDDERDDNLLVGLQAPVTETNASEAETFWSVHWGEHYRLLAVDMSAPDAAIERAFQLWLKQARGAQQPLARITDTDFHLWAASHALAYIDLTSYARATGQKFTQPQLADALFPDAEVDRVERLRKVTMKHADRMLSDEMQSRLAGQLGAAATPYQPF